MRELGPVERTVLAELYAWGEKIGHCHGHRARDVARRLERGGLTEGHSWTALRSLEELGLVEQRDAHCKALPGPAALALRLEPPLGHRPKPGARLRPSVLALRAI